MSETPATDRVLALIGLPTVGAGLAPLDKARAAELFVGEFVAHIFGPTKQLDGWRVVEAETPADTWQQARADAADLLASVAAEVARLEALRN